MNYYNKLLVLLFLLMPTAWLGAQDNITETYLDKTAQFAKIYNGRMEASYPSLRYENLPYYKGSGYAEGRIVYEGIAYPQVAVRLDLYKDGLAVKSPGDNYSILLVNEYVDSLYIRHDVFIYLKPDNAEGLGAGYYRLLHDGGIKLLHRQHYKINTRDVKWSFSEENQYYLLSNGKPYRIKNKNSFTKLFPAHKKEIDRYAKEQQLNFKHDKESSFLSLALYCEELIGAEKQPVYVEARKQVIPPETAPLQPDSLTYHAAYGHSFYAPKEIWLDTIFSFSKQETYSYQEIEREQEDMGTGYANSENKIYAIGDPFSGAEESRSYELKGRIVDSKTKEPLVGINIISKETNEGSTTDRKGFYELHLSPGRHQLQITGFNIKDARRQVMIYSDGKLDIEIIEETLELDEVTVFAGRINQVKNTEIGIERLQVAKIKNIPQVMGEPDLLRAIQTLPGVKTVGEASTGFNVRGGATDQNLILLNDNTLYNPSHLFGFFTAFSSDMVSEAEIYKSSIPSRYGGRISSVLNVTGKEASMDEFSGKLGIGLVTSSLALEVPVVKEKASILLTGRTTYSDWILKQLPEDSGYNNGRAGFYDLGLVYTHKVNPTNKLNVYGYYSADRFSFTENEKYQYRNFNASLSWQSRLGDKLNGSLAVGYDHYDYMNRQYYPEFSAYRLGFDINQFFGKVDFSYFLNKHKIDFGIKSTLYNLDAGIYEPENKASIIQPDRLQTEKALESALYVGDTWEINQAWSVDAGIRYSMFNALGPRSYYTYDPHTLPYESTMQDTVEVAKNKIFQTYQGPEFRLSVRYLLNNHLSLKAGYNTMRQYIHKISNTLVMSPTDTWKLSDTNIKPQRGWQAAGGIFFNAPSLEWEVSLEGYYKKMHDYLDYRPGAHLIMNHHIETDVINTEGYAYGIELSFRKTIGRLTGWTSYTYSRTFLRQSDKLIANPVNDGEWYPTDYDKPHDFKFVGNFRLTQRYSVSLNMDYSTGRPATIPAGRYFDHAQQEYRFVYTDRNSHRIPDYFRADISFNVEPHHKLTLLTHSTLNFGIYNLTGRNNAYNVYYVSEEGKIQGYKLSIFGSPIPFITYNIKF